MGILGNAGSLYMILLIILLVIGFGLFGLWLIDEAFGAGKKALSPKGSSVDTGKKGLTKGK